LDFKQTEEILGTMLNPVNSTFLFASETNGIMKGFTFDPSSKKITPNLTFNWNNILWRG
jgi:hypothetical protein